MSGKSLFRTVFVCLLSVSTLISLALISYQLNPASAFSDANENINALPETTEEKAKIPIVLKQAAEMEYAKVESVEVRHPFAIPGSEVLVQLDTAALPDMPDGKCKIWFGGDIGYLTTKCLSVTLNPSGSALYTLATSGEGIANFTITKSSHLFGTVWYEGRVFEIEPVSGNVHRVVELRDDIWAKVTYENVLVADQKENSKPAAIDPEITMKDRVIDILTLYTPKLARKVEKQSGGHLDIETAISGVVSATNGFITSSNVKSQLRLVGTLPVSFMADKYHRIEEILKNLQQGKKEFKGIADIRKRVGADLVVLLMSRQENDLFDSPKTPFSTAFRPMTFDDLKPENGYAVITYRNSGYESQVSFARAFASLLGVAGSYHEHKSPGQKPFMRAAWGHHIGPKSEYPFGEAGQYGTLMTSAKSIVPFYSNPNVLVYGEQIGKWQQDKDDAFAARAMNIASRRVADYVRGTVNTPPEAVAMKAKSDNQYRFIFRDLQGAGDIASMYVRFAEPDTGKNIEISYDVRVKSIGLKSNDAEKVTRQVSAPEGDALGCSISEIQLSQISLSSNADLMSLELPVLFKESVAGTFEVYAKAHDFAGTTAGWKTLGTHIVRPANASGISPAADELLAPKVQLLTNAGKTFYVGPDIYAGMYNFDNKTLSQWVSDVAGADMNYIRLILQANTWFDTESDWVDNVGTPQAVVKASKSIITRSGSDYTLNVDESGTLWSNFKSGVQNARTSGVTLHLDLMDTVWSKNKVRFDLSEYSSDNNNLGHVPNNANGDEYRKAMTLAMLHSWNGTTTYDGYSLYDTTFESRIRGSNGIFKKIMDVLKTEGANYHIIGDGNELWETGGITNYDYSRAVLESPGVSNYTGPMALGNTGLWPGPGTLADNPGSNATYISNNIDFLCVHGTLDGGLFYDRDDYIGRYLSLSNIISGSQRVLFSTDGTRLEGSTPDRPTHSQLRRLYYDLVTEHRNGANQYVPIMKVGGLGDIKVPGYSGLTHNALFTYWRDSVNKPPVVDSLDKSGSGRIRTFVLDVEDLDGWGNVKTIDLVIDGVGITDFGSHGAFANSAHLRYTVTGSRLALANNAGTLGTGVVISSTASDPNISNSQVDITSARVVKNGNKIELTVTCNFTTNYFGTKNIHVRLIDKNKGDAHYNTGYMSFWGTISLPLPPQYGRVKVNFTPHVNPTSEDKWYHRKWRLNGIWYNSGETSAQVLVGNHTVTFNADAGFQIPSPITVPVSAGQTTSRTQDFPLAVGNVKGQVRPNAARIAGAKWQIVGGYGSWRNHNEVISGVLGHKQEIRFIGLSGWSRPGNFNVPIIHSQTVRTEDYGDVTYTAPGVSEGIKSASGTNGETRRGVGPAVTYTKLASTGNVRVDFDGDGKADIALYRPHDGTWHVYGKGVIARWGSGEDCYPVPADYNGDGKTDIAVYYPRTAIWSIKGIGDFKIGKPWSNPMPGDYDDNGITDMAVYNEKSLRVYTHTLNKNRKVNKQTLASLPNGFAFAGDFDGDGRDEFAEFDNESRSWLSAKKGRFSAGSAKATPLLGDFNGDGKTDYCFFNNEQGTWKIEGFDQAFTLGMSGDVPVIADFDGDNKADIAVFRPATGEWIVNGQIIRFGQAGDIPLAGGK